MSHRLVPEDQSHLQGDVVWIREDKLTPEGASLYSMYMETAFWAFKITYLTLYFLPQIDGQISFDQVQPVI